MWNFGALKSLFQSQTQNLVVDLGSFTCGNSHLGKTPDSRDFFAQALAKRDVVKLEALGYSMGLGEGDLKPNENLFSLKSEGFEIGTKDGMIDYWFLTINSFTGSYRYKAKPLMLSNSVTPDEVQQRIGMPYWIDNSDGETIMFYEYQRGTVELQFEFPDQRSLCYITLMKDGILSAASARKAYNVTAPWPPLEKV